jgi:predicted nucleotidyltransferase
VQGFSAAGSQTREVRYDWLRSVLARAENENGAAQKDIFGAISRANKKPVSVDTLLTAARQRLRTTQHKRKPRSRPLPTSATSENL